jgi:broad specificity phosphatase PhoE
MRTLVHLVRHGHVHNPRKVVYGRLAGFHLSEDGRRQAEAAAEHLSARRVARVYSSPLERARATADVIAQRTGAEVEVRDAVIETDVGDGWLGRPWSEVRSRRSAQWNSYLHRPHEVDFMGETFEEAGRRVAAEVRALAAGHPGEEIVVVSHGDPLKAGILALTGGHVRDLHRHPVPTGGIVTVEVGEGAARVVSRWTPASAVDAQPARP